VISGFLRELDENCALQGYNAASSGNFLTTFWNILMVQKINSIFCNIEADGAYS
jgi:hypothetical protein